MPDLKPIISIIGILLAILSAAMLLPLLVDLAEGHDDWLDFLWAAGLTLFFAVMMLLATGGELPRQFTLQQTFLLTTASWLMLTAFAAVPLVLAGPGLSYADAFFEAMSGLTTTGATVIVGLEAMPPGILLWRAVLHWIGGLGIIVMGLAIFPTLQVGGMQLFRAESSEKTEKVLPRATQIATATAIIYLALSLACAVAYMMAGMTGFDAVCHAMSAVATAGFSTRDASIGGFDSAAIEWISVLFMLSGAITFTAYIQAVRGRPAVLWRDAQIRWFAGIVTVSAGLMTLWLWLGTGVALGPAIRLASFNVTSVITTTGFASADYNTWGSFALVLFVALMFVGGCTGSTTGAVKVFRFAVLYAIIRRELFRLTHPHGVYTPGFNGMPIPPGVAMAVMGFFFLYGLGVAVVAGGLALMGLDGITAVSGAISAMGNIGPGFGPVIGPAGSYAPLPGEAKILLALAMLLGRLEIFTVLVILTPGFWRG